MLLLSCTSICGKTMFVGLTEQISDDTFRVHDSVYSLQDGATFFIKRALTANPEQLPVDFGKCGVYNKETNTVTIFSKEEMDFFKQLTE